MSVTHHKSLVRPTHQHDAALEEVPAPNLAVDRLQEGHSAEAAQRLVRHVHHQVAHHALDQLDLRAADGLVCCG